MNNPLAEYAFQQTRCTYIIHMQIIYQNQHSESLPDQEDNTSFLVEELVAQTLLTLFDGVLIDEVKITNTVQEMSVIAMHMLRLNVRCPHHAFPANLDEVKMIEYTVEQKLGCAFLELFDMVEIERVEVRFIPTENK